jgi:hypothetical protein
MVFRNGMVAGSCNGVQQPVGSGVHVHDVREIATLGTLQRN